MLVRVLVALVLLTATIGARADDAHDAEAAVLSFTTAFFSGNVAEAADMFHPEGHRALRSLMIHVAETTRDFKERREFYRIWNVKSLTELRRLDDKALFTGLFRRLWQESTPEFTAMWRASKVSIIGSVREGDTYHVVFRTHVSLQAGAEDTVSLASVKQDDGRWKVVSSIEMDLMKRRLVSP